jgi:two-component system, NarL family, nitrate/nitrite response regulator NarL
MKMPAGALNGALANALTDTLNFNRPLEASLKPPLRVVLVYDDPESVSRIGEAFCRAGIELLPHRYRSPAATLDRLRAQPPDSVLLDLSKRSALSVEECIRKLKAKMPALPVVVLSASMEKKAVLGSLLAGASGHLTKPVGNAELLFVVQPAVAGFALLCAKTRSLLGEPEGFLHAAGAESGDAEALTRMEEQVLARCMKGMSDKEIATDLDISPRTVTTHVQNILRKLNVCSRAEASRKYTGLA